MENKIEKPILLLNIDINQTIIFKDLYNNQSLETGLINCFCSEIWGSVNKDENKWVLYSDNLSSTPPAKNLISYSDYINSIYKLKTEKEIPDEKQRYEINLKIYDKQFQENIKFFDKGYPGEPLKQKYNTIINKLKIPENIMKEIDKENSLYEDFYKNLYVNGYNFILPSLFRLMIELHNQKRVFKIIFRTFGKDFNDLKLEFNSFCEGKHPIFNGKIPEYPKLFFDGTHGSTDYRILDENIGVVKRFSENEGDCILVIGENNEKSFKNKNELMDYYNKKNNKIICGNIEIFKYFKNFLDKNNYNSVIISDDFEYWFKHGELKEYGKIMFIDPDNEKVHPIFFDDCINDDDKSIVDCWNIKTGVTMSNKETINKYIFKVYPIEAVCDEFYFLNKVKEAETNRKNKD